MRKLLVCLCMITCLFANSQVRRIGVLGSSTSNGQGVPFDSSWVQLLRAEYRSIGLIDTLQKIAASTFDCYSGMPTGYVPPAGRNNPNTSYNITRLMSRVPAPTTVIINYPTTNFHIFSDQEILFCLDSIRQYANARGANVFVATTQPRDNYDDAGRARLKYLNGVIKSYFGDSTIDFFTPLNNPSNNKLKPEYVLGDGVHPNSAGQRVLYQQVLAKNVLNVDMSTVQRVLIDVGEAAGTTASPDASNRWWNNMTDARKGLRVNNAITTGGQPTTIRLEVVNPLGSTVTTNTNVGSGGAVGAVQEYGVNATKDHALVSTGITNGTWRFYGLDPQKTYTIRFWGSNVNSGYRILQVKMAEENTWQEYNATNNRLYTTAANFAFKGKTEQLFNFRVKTNSVAAHISVVEIVATSSLEEIPEPPNHPPVAVAGPDTIITLPAELQLNGSGTDPDGTVSYAWSQLDGPSQSSFSALDIADPVITGITAGTYSYELMVTDNDGAIDKDTVSITANPAPIVATDQRVLIDLGLSSGPTSTDQWNKRWNNVTDLRTGVQLSNAVSTTNDITTISLEVVRPVGSKASNDRNVRTSNTVGIVGEYPASATNDNGLADKTITNGQWKFSGLQPGSVYTFKFWGSIAQSGPRIVQIKTADQATWKEFNTAQNLNYNQAADFTITGTTEIAFDVRVKSGSNYGHINVVDILVQVPSNAAPVANAGNDATIRMPVDSILLNGGLSSDADGVITGYNWQQIGGQPVMITGAATASPLVRNLIAGNYLFRLTVTDDSLASASDTVSVTVNQANTAPVVYAGEDAAIRLPLSSYQLSAIAIDPDGTIGDYKWFKTAGPLSGALADSTGAQVMTTNLVAGTYRFAVRVTDNEGATATDTVSVVVLPPLNTAPVANAGIDQLITLPASAQLNGSGTDQEGPVTVAWTRLTGAAISFSSATVRNPVLGNLAAGVYTFELKVTDQDGLWDSDTMQLTVNPAVTQPAQRVLIDLGWSSSTTTTDQWGKRWNNVTDLRAGLRLNNAITTTGQSTTIKLEVIRTTGSVAANDLNVRNAGAVGIVGEYPASATTDNGLADKTITNGQWKVSGLQNNVTYNIKFWGSMVQSGARMIQIKRADQQVWQEYNATGNVDYDQAANFSFTGVTELAFDIRVKAGSSYGHINVIDITASEGSSSVAKGAMKTFAAQAVEPAEKTGTLVYPNPTNGVAMLHLQSAINGKGEVTIINMAGQVVKRIAFTKTSAVYTQRIDLSGNASGLYLIRVAVGDQVSEHRLMKN